MAIMEITRVVVSALILISHLVKSENEDHGASVVSYTADNFENEIVSKRHFVMFYAPWCGHCKRLSPTWNELAKIYNRDLEQTELIIAKVDCTKETALCADQDVKSYPTLKYFYGSKSDSVRYREQRDLSSLQNFVEEQFNKPEEVPPEVPKPVDGLVELTDEIFSKSIGSGYIFLMFYAPWCEYSKKLAPTWKELAKLFQDNEKILIAKIDCTKNRASCDLYKVNNYPTMILFKNGQKIENYVGDRSFEDLTEFLSKLMGDDIYAEGPIESIPDSPMTEDGEPESQVAELSTDNFEEAVSEGLVFVKFYAPWCGHCKRLAPVWEDLSKKFIGNSEVTIAKIDCTQFSSTCTQHEVNAYPTLIIFRNGVKLDEFEASRTLQNLHRFVMKHFTRDEL